MINFFKKYHKWLGIIFTLFILFFSLSGIILNHRQTFANFDISRSFLPKEYHYNHWNNAAVRGTVKIGTDSILIYGNIGIWLSDEHFVAYTDFNKGFPDGIDNRKIEKVHLSKKGHLFAGTLFGLYRFDQNHQQWQKCQLPGHEERITDICDRNDEVLVMTRSHLYVTTDGLSFDHISIPSAVDYDNKVGLFKTLWIIHSGEIWGLPGILLVDAIGIVFIFLSLSGLIYFLIPFIHRKRKKKKLETHKLSVFRRWNLKWHNKIGWITLVLLIITSFTGMFLRPPLLIPIAESRVGKIPFTELDTPNPWYDQLRRINYDENTGRYLLATPYGVYYSDDGLQSTLQKFRYHPPISVMGVNVFEQLNKSVYLVGSFEGLFIWDTETGAMMDYIKKAPPQKKERGGPPLGEFMVTGYSSHYMGGEVFFDFNRGALPINRTAAFPKMPQKIEHQQMSWWNVALEVHTARMYKFMFGQFYILFIPLAGIVILFVLISGFLVWWRRY